MRNTRCSPVSLALVIVLGVLVLGTACDAFFTLSPLSMLRRDPATMSVEQRVRYAEIALESGDETLMATAYNALIPDLDPDDIAGNAIAADIALILSGADDVVIGLVGMMSNPAADVTTLFASIDAIDAAYITAAVAYLNNVIVAGGQGRPTEFVMIALGYVKITGEVVGGVVNLSTTLAAVPPVLTYEQTLTLLDRLAVIQYYLDLAVEVGAPDLSSFVETIIETP